MLMLTVQKFACLGQPKNIKQYPQKSHLKVGVISCISSPEQNDVELAHTSSPTTCMMSVILVQFHTWKANIHWAESYKLQCPKSVLRKRPGKTGEQLLVHMEAVV